MDRETDGQTDGHTHTHTHLPAILCKVIAQETESMKMKSQVVRCEAAAKELAKIDSVFDTMVSPQQLEFVSKSACM